jgi:parallel beta-helix repeat protein
VIAGFTVFITFEPEVVEAATTLYVGGSGFGNYSTIQAAVDDASPGDTVYVYSGAYYENVIVNKTINLTGEDRDTTIIDGDGQSDGVFVNNVNYFNMSGFGVRNGTGGLQKSGIYLDSSSNISIYNNKIHDNEYGIFLYLSSFINIQGNEIYNNLEGVWTTFSSNNSYINNIVHDHKIKVDNFGMGFFFTGAPYSNNKIEGNLVYNNDADGIHLEDLTGPDSIEFWNNTIFNNTVYNNSMHGIFIGSDGRNNFIINNTVHHNGFTAINPRAGIRISWSPNNIIIGNIVHSNNDGISLEKSINNQYTINNTIADNTIYNNNISIRLKDAIDNTFIGNSIFNNNYSIYMGQQSSGNTFINNTFSNATTHVYIKEQSVRSNFVNCTLTDSRMDDFNLSEDSHAFLLNTTFNKTRVYYGDILSSLTVNWFMHVNVIYWNGTPVSYAKIWVNDTFGSNIINGPADSEGWTRWTVVFEYVEQDMDGNHIGDRFYFTPHNVTATDGILWGYADPNMNISKVVQIILGIPTSLLPPKNLTIQVVNFGNNVELEWEPPPSVTLDHYLIYRADSATDFDFTIPYNSSITWPDPKNTTWVDPDSSITSVDDDFYYIVRAANFDESDISSTSNTAGVWTKTFEPGISTFSLPLEPFVKKDTEFYCQDMNASYIKWMNLTTHTWMQHDKGDSQNNSLVEVGEGYEIGFLGKSIQTRYTFTGLPGAMIVYDDDILFSGFDPSNDAKSLTASIEPNGDVILTWQEPTSMVAGDYYEVYYSNTRDGFFGTFGNDYDLACPSLGYGTNITTITGFGANNPGARLYFMVIPFTSLGIRGASMYSIGIWTEEYLAGYDTFGIPLKLNTYQSADWYCDIIPDTVGINYFIDNQQRWGWHSTRMPQGAYDPLLEMVEGYQISTFNATNYTFIGI